MPAGARALPAPGNVLVPLKGATSPAKGCAGPGPVTEQAGQSHALRTTLHPCLLSLLLRQLPWHRLSTFLINAIIPTIIPTCRFSPHSPTFPRPPSLTSPSQRIPQTHGIFKGCSNHLGDRACPELNLRISEHQPHLQGFSRDQQMSTEHDEHPRSCLRIPTTPSEP